jgi:hypothetical protein
VDPVILGCVGIAALGMVALGAALLMDPARCTRALNEWYVIVPAVGATNRIGLLVCRAAGAGLIGGGVALALSAVHLISQLG